MRLIIDTENPIKIDLDKISADDRVTLIELLDRYKQSIIFSTKKIIKSTSDLDGSEPKWLPELLKDIGKTVVSPYKGIFKGIEETFEDYYYIIETDEGKTVYETCVSSIDFS
nr:MAG TPA: hypothetical protein [Crassvirales sp.]